MTFDLDVTAGPTPSDEELHWPDDGDITKTWVVVKQKLGEHDRRLTEHDGRLEEAERRHEQIDTWVVEHEETHDKLSAALNAIHADLQQEKAMHKVEIDVLRQAFKDIGAQQSAAAERAVKHYDSILDALKAHGRKDEFWYGVQVVVWGVFGLVLTYWLFTK